MEVDEDYNVNNDSMSEEEEYEPLDMNTYKKKPKKQSYKRAQRNFVVEDDVEIEYQRPLKKRKKVQQDINICNNTNSVTSTSIINTMKRNKDYDRRATTKILTATEKQKKDLTLKPKKKRKRKSKNAMDLFSTTKLIQQKTTQNSIHANVALTEQEKYLKKQYELIQKLLAKKKKKAKKKDILNGTSVLEAAMGNNLNTASSNNIILEPGQIAPTQSTISSNTTSFSETFIKPSTQYIQQRNNSISTKKGIDIDDYFNSNQDHIHLNKKPLSYQEKMQLDQKKALQKLKKMGDTKIGASPIKEQKPKFSIKRTRKNKRITTPNHMAISPIHSIITNDDDNMNNNDNNKMDVDDLNDLNDMNNNNDIDLGNGGLNDTGIISTDNVSSNTSLNSNGLNSTINSLPSYDEAQETDTTTLNLQKFELARKAAEDKSNAIDDEEHLENCNVYVGGLHPEVDQSMLRKLFGHCGDIKQIRLDWRKKGFGFIHYSTHEQAREAIEDMDGRLIMGQPIKCRWAKNKNKERERELRLEKELKEKLLAEQDPNDPNDPNNLNQQQTQQQQQQIDDINTNHPQQLYHRRPGIGNNNNNQNNNHNNNNNQNNESGSNNVTSIGFLSRRMGARSNNKSMNGPPALIKMNNQNNQNNKDNDDGIVDNNDESGEVEYW